MDQKLASLMDAYWKDFVEKKDESFVVKPSIPIIWFGDMKAYRKSKRKIVTVAINPSKVEFKEKPKSKQYTFCRFQNGEKLCQKDELTADDKELLYASLNSYFKDNPYKRWFDAFEKPLNCLDATYYSGKEYESTAIHIDIKSAIASDPTWGSLRKKEKAKLENDSLFQELLEYLKPNIILYSKDMNTFKKIFDRDIKEDANDYFKDEKKKKGEKEQTIYIATHHVTIRDENILIIAGRNMRGTPFGGFTPGFIEEKFGEIKSKPQYQFAFQK